MNMNDGDDANNLLITGATVLTGNDNREIIEGGAVAISGDRIVAVGTSDDLRRQFPDMETLDATGKAVMPGFMNSHTHAVLLVLRGTVEDMSGDAIFGYMTPISFAMTDDERRALARLGCLEAIRSGTTTLVEPFRFITGYAQGMVETGMRLWLSENGADALTLKIRHGIYEYDRAFGQEFLDRITAMVEQFHNTEDGRVQCQMAAHAPDVCSPWMLGQLNELAQKYDLTRTVHLAQSPGEVKQVRAAYDRTPAEYLLDNDWLGPDVVAAHWTYCTDADIDLLAEHGVHMAHCPANSSRRGPHKVRVGRIQDAGVNIVLGTDNMTEDMFQALKIGSIIHRGGLGGQHEGGGVDPTPQMTFDAATRNGAKALGAEADLGSLEAGKKADLTILDLNQAHLRPIINLVSSIVHYANPSAVQSVMIDGRFVMRDGKVLTMDEDAVIAEAQEATVAAWHRLAETSGDIEIPPGLK
ncbi:MAG: amidohydrolase family protein [Rhodospirillaceae bacterium]|nr:amidohydrolase family protein [Rhodospirillaceae bacterium]